MTPILLKWASKMGVGQDMHRPCLPVTALEDIYLWGRGRFSGSLCMPVYTLGWILFIPWDLVIYCTYLVHIAHSNYFSQIGTYSLNKPGNAHVDYVTTVGEVTTTIHRVVVAQRGMWWLNGSAPDCKTCSPGFESGISPTCMDMSFLVGEPAGLAW